MVWLAWLAPAKIFGAISSSFSFVLKHWKQFAIIGMIALIIYQNFMMFEMLKWVGVRTIPGIEQEYSEYVEALALCELGREELKQAIEERNNEIGKWVDQSIKLQSQHDNLSQELEEMKQTTDDKVNVILQGPTPQGCAGAMDFLRDSAMGDLQW